MIIPKRKVDRKQNIVSLGITLLLTVIVYGILVAANLSELRQNKELYRQIDFVRIIETLPKMEPEIREPTAVEKATPEEVTEPQPVRNIPQRVNLRDVLPEGLRVDLTVSEAAVHSRSVDAGDGGGRALKIERADLGSVGGFQTLSDLSLSLPSANDRQLGDGGTGRGGLTLEAGQGVSPGRSGYAADFSGDANILGGPRGHQDDGGTGVQIGLRDLREFGENYSDLAPIYRALVEWMRKNPATLPVPIRRLMAEDRWDPSFLSSRVKFGVSEKLYDMLLMCKEEIYEVHIVLVERNDATYLIDRNFQKESNSLRVGGVDISDGDIASVQSQMQAAGDRRTREFYQIFLSWWDSVKHEVEQ
jgi:hypothetical protein